MKHEASLNIIKFSLQKPFRLLLQPSKAREIETRGKKIEKAKRKIRDASIKALRQRLSLCGALKATREHRGMKKCQMALKSFKILFPYDDDEGDVKERKIVSFLSFFHSAKTLSWAQKQFSNLHAQISLRAAVPTFFTAFRVKIFKKNFFSFLVRFSFFPPFVGCWLSVMK